MNKKIIIPIIVVLLIVIVYQVAFNKKEEALNLVKVARGDLAEEISETGQVQKGEKINLGFKNAGRIENIYVKVGEEVGRGESLAKI